MCELVGLRWPGELKDVSYEHKEEIELESK